MGSDCISSCSLLIFLLCGSSPSLLLELPSSSCCDSEFSLGA